MAKPTPDRPPYQLLPTGPADLRDQRWLDERIDAAKAGLGAVIEIAENWTDGRNVSRLHPGVSAADYVREHVGIVGRGAIVPLLERSNWSNRQIAAVAGTSEGFVRKQLRTDTQLERPAETLGADGKVRKTKPTAGRTRRPPPERSPEPLYRRSMTVSTIRSFVNNLRADHAVNRLAFDADEAAFASDGAWRAAVLELVADAQDVLRRLHAVIEDPVMRRRAKADFTQSDEMRSPGEADRKAAPAPNRHDVEPRGREPPAGPITFLEPTPEVEAMTRKWMPVAMVARCVNCGFRGPVHPLFPEKGTYDQRRHYRAEHPGMWEDRNRPKGVFLYEWVALNADGEAIDAPGGVVLPGTSPLASLGS